MDLIVRNGTIVTATDTCQADIGVQDGKVAQIGGAFGPASAARVIDARGALVLPGGVDVHTHLDTPGQGTVTADDYRTGTLAAACGGTTSIVNFCFQEQGQSFADLLAHYHARARARAAIDYGFHVAITDLGAASPRELAALPAQGVTSFKLYMAYKGSLMIDDWTLLNTLEVAKRSGALVMVHAENGDACQLLQGKLLAEGKTAPAFHAASRPPRVEAEATARAIALAEVVGAPIYVVHVSCAEAIEEIERGRKRGVAAFAETCPHYLYFSQEDLERPGFEGAKWVYTPPPREKHQRAALWQALQGGVLSTVSSDHCPFNFRGQKELGRDDFTRIPNGAPGIEERLMLVYQGVARGQLTPGRFVDLVATTPAKLFGLYPAKGTVMVGGDADLVIWDPAVELTVSRSALHHNVDYTLYEGMRVRGAPRTVILRGDVVVEERQYVGRPGAGRFIARRPFAAPAG